MKKQILRFRKRMTLNNGDILDAKHIFILPNKNGYIFLSVLVVMIFFGLNYENNLILIVAFLAVSVLITSLFLTYHNLLGVSVKVQDPQYDIFAGNAITLPVYINSNKHRPIRNLLITTAHGPALFVNDIPGNTQSSISLPPLKRGFRKVKRLSVSTNYPLGLFQAFSYIEPHLSILVLPQPETCEYLLQKTPQSSNLMHENTNNTQRLISSIAKGNDEICGLKPYRMGEPINLIDWRQSAKGRGIMIKDFSADQNMSFYLTKDSIKSLDLEEQISMLTYAVIDLTMRNIQFGFDFNGLTYKPDCSRDHRQRILISLATL